MSWMAKLYDTYEQGMQLAVPDDQKPMPISHTVQNAHINIVVDNYGNFLRASVLEKTLVVLPATERSAGRSSGEAAHPLADKLQYLAGDYATFGGKKSAYFSSYVQQLRQWCESPFTHASVRAVLQYVEKASVIQDLTEHKITWLDEAGVLLTAWPEESETAVPLLMKVLPKESGQLDQGNALVCWTVEAPGEVNSDTWKDRSLQQSWIDFDSQNTGHVGLCFVSGERQPMVLSHPSKLRHSGDKAKLVSSNDLSGFTFKGRFTDTKQSIEKQGMQAAGVGSITSQKAHNALRWLIKRQGFRNGDQVVVAWAVSGKTIPELLVDTTAFELDDFEEVEPQEEHYLSVAEMDYTVDIGQSFANKLNLYMRGYNKTLQPNENIVIMAIDSATPGRMAITYYREMLAEDYLDQVASWHRQFAWRQRVPREVARQGKAPKTTVTWPVSAPAPWTILNAAYGDIVKGNDALKKNLYERLLPCIIEGRNIPYDLVQRCIKRASRPQSSEHWEWERNVGAACALYRGFFNRHANNNKRRDFPMSLDQDNCSRDYLYGRLLALAERIEEQALFVASVNRPTTANRLMQRFADHPYTTWLTIYKQIQPYIQQLQVSRAGFLTNRKKDIDSVMGQFKTSDFTSDRALSGEFLLGFHCQRLWLREKTESTEGQI